MFLRVFGAVLVPVGGFTVLVMGNDDEGGTNAWFHGDLPRLPFPNLTSSASSHTVDLLR